MRPTPSFASIHSWPEWARLLLGLGWRVGLAALALAGAWCLWQRRAARLGHQAGPAPTLPAAETEWAEGRQALSVADMHRLAQEASRMQDA